jgi:thiamine-phosphate diphosphorylase
MDHDGGRAPNAGAWPAMNPLPRLLFIADARTVGGRVPAIVAEAVHYGVRAVVLRARDLPTAPRLELAATVRRLLAPVDGLLIMAGGHGDAVHLAARESFPEPRPALVGRSCHNADDVARAAAQRCDYATVSPIYPTVSKPGYGPTLGPSGLAALCRPGLPVFALGGVVPDAVPDCLAAGAYGVAVMGPILRSPVIVTEYLERLSRWTHP